MFRSKPMSSSSSSSSTCKKHPKHKQSPGVCSLCLAQKLAKIPLVIGTRDALCRRVCSAEGSSYASSQVSSSSSSDVSSDVSSCVSPRNEMMKKKEKSRFWSRLMIIRGRNNTKRDTYFHAQVVLSHSEPLPTIASAT